MAPNSTSFYRCCSFYFKVNGLQFIELNGLSLRPKRSVVEKSHFNSKKPFAPKYNILQSLRA